MFNQVILIGNLGRDPDCRTTQSGTKVANFSMATSTGSGDKKKTEWHNVVAWAKTSEFVEKYAKKGTLVMIVGEQRTRKWTSKDGVDKWSTEVHLGGFGSTFRVLSGGGSNDEEREDDPPPLDDDDDIPF